MMVYGVTRTRKQYEQRSEIEGRIVIRANISVMHVVTSRSGTRGSECLAVLGWF
jgi:hypothetical protein